MSIEIAVDSSIHGLRFAADLLQEIARLSASKAICEALLDAAISIAGAETAVIVLDPQIRTTAFHARAANRADVRADLVSRSIADRVLRGGREFVAEDALSNASGARTASIQRLQIRSIAAFPISIDDRVFGAICIDHRQRTFAFSGERLQAVRDLTHLSALFLRNALREESRAAEQRRKGRGRSETAPDLRPNPALMTPPVPDIVYVSRAMRLVQEQAIRCSKSPKPVLITGETGVGKELIARLIAAVSFRATAPWHAENCTCLGNLASSELFGHVEGAFTGAVRDRLGWFRFCNGGALFLDEVARLPLETQGMLLRVLENGLVIPSGSEQAEFVSVKVIAATSADLDAEVQAERFLFDLAFRLSVHRIHVPALRDRPEDVVPLMKAFLAKLRPGACVTPEAEALMPSLVWPGNVRHVESVAHNLVLLPGLESSASDVMRFYQAAPKPPAPRSPLLKEAVAELEKQMIRQALLKTGGVVAKAAGVLGVDESTLRKKIKALGLFIAP